MEYVSAIKNDIFPFVTTWMDLPRVYCAELNKSDRERQAIWFYFYVESKAQNIQIHRFREHVDGCQKGEGFGVMGEKGEELESTNYFSDIWGSAWDSHAYMHRDELSMIF